MKNIIKKSVVTAIIITAALMLAAPVSAEAANKIKLNKTKVTLNMAKTRTYKLKVKGTKKKVKWKTSNKKVVTVSKSGKVTAKKKGSATITAKVSKKTLKCKVTIKDTRKNNGNSNNQTGSNCTIKFNPNKGKIVYGKSSVKIQKNKKIGGLPIPLRRGYILKGWYNGSKKVTNDTTFSASTTLTAKWKKTTNNDLYTYMDRNYIRTILYDELVSIPTDNGNSNMSYESDATIKSYMCSTGINQGWRMCNWFDPDYFARKMLSTYGVTFDSYKDAWECAIGFRNCRSVDEYIKIIKGTCEHDGGTTSDGKTCTFDTYVQAVTEDILVKSFIACGCGETFDDLQHHTMHEIYKEFEGDTTIHAYGPLDIHKTKVINPAYINHEHRTYCKNSGEVVSTKTTTSPWTGVGSGMPEDPCKHEYLLVNKGLDDQYEICRKCGERK